MDWTAPTIVALAMIALAGWMFYLDSKDRRR